MMCHELTSVSSFVSTKMHALTPRHQQQQHIEETSTRASTMRAPHALHPSIINLFVATIVVAISVLCVADLAGRAGAGGAVGDVPVQAQHLGDGDAEGQGVWARVLPGDVPHAVRVLRSAGDDDPLRNGRKARPDAGGNQPIHPCRRLQHQADRPHVPAADNWKVGQGRVYRGRVCRVPGHQMGHGVAADHQGHEERLRRSAGQGTAVHQPRSDA
mmetsp:Transcript_11091/g.31890  ORF Transcript_11091/g.31890 Transcript_11091/m.31890 type:complete len:215 (+) Transcript_11091:339-983(+)